MDKACKSNGFRPMADEVVTRRYTYPKVRDNQSKDWIIPDGPARVKIYRFGSGLRSISLLVR